MHLARKQLRSDTNVDDVPDFVECSVRGVTFKCGFSIRLRDPIKLVVSESTIGGLIQAIPFSHRSHKASCKPLLLC